MDGGGEGRRVGKVHGVEVFYPGAHGDTGHGDVHHLVHTAAAQHLDAQQLVAFPVGNQLGHKGSRTGIVVGLVVGDAGDGDGIKARGLGLLFGQTGTAGIEPIRQTHHTGAQAAAVGSGFPRQILGQEPAGDVGGGAHGGPLALAGQTVVDHGAVAHGVNIGKIGLLELVHHNGALKHLHAGIVQEGGGRTDTDGHHYHVTLKAAHSGTDAGGLLAAQNHLKARAGDHPDALGLELAADVVGNLGVKQIGHHLRGHVHHRDLQALLK